MRARPEQGLEPATYCLGGGNSPPTSCTSQASTFPLTCQDKATEGLPGTCEGLHDVTTSDHWWDQLGPGQHPRSARVDRPNNLANGATQAADLVSPAAIDSAFRDPGH